MTQDRHWERGLEAARGQDFRGRGPAGYRRRDARIREDLCEAMTEDPWLDASGIEVEVSGGVVTLAGTVDSGEAKRRAEILAERCSGVEDVINTLRCQRPGAPRSGGRPGPADIPGSGANAGDSPATRTNLGRA